MLNGPDCKKLAKYPDGEPVNLYQKATWLANIIAKWVCPPNSHALVLGSGAGGDVMGLMNFGLDITCVERETKQVEAMVGLLRLYVPEDTTHLMVNNYTIRQMVANEAQIADIESWVCPGCPEVEYADGSVFTQCSSCSINFCRDHFPEFAEDGGMCVPCRAKNPKAPAQAVVVVDPHAAVLAIEPEKEAAKEPEEPASEPV
jgi:hypothetical protein